MTMSKGSHSKERILQAGIELLSVSGTGAVTFGALAERASVSKSGLFAHFADKDDLERQLFHLAERIFIRDVMTPAMQEPTPLRRLERVLELWLGWAARSGLKGGCPFVAAASELDDTPGSLRDYLAESQSRFIATIVRLIDETIASGELSESTDAKQTAFEILGIYLAHHYVSRLLHDTRAEKKAKKAFSNLLDRQRATTSRKRAN